MNNDEDALGRRRKEKVTEERGNRWQLGGKAYEGERRQAAQSADDSALKVLTSVWGLGVRDCARGGELNALRKASENALGWGRRRMRSEGVGGERGY